MSLAPVQAQVNRCVDKAGKVFYSDVLCPANAVAQQQIARKRSADELDEERERAEVHRLETEQRSANMSAATAELRAAQARLDAYGRGPNGGGMGGASASARACDIARRNLETAEAVVTAARDTTNERRKAALACKGVEGQRTSEAAGFDPRQLSPHSMIESCDGSGCWTLDGERYTGSGTTYSSPGGTRCTRSGSMLVCP